MKKAFLMLLVSSALTQAKAQEFSGFRTGAYTGVNGVFFNPANIAGNKYRFDVNLFSLSTMAANDQASFKLGTMSDNFKGDSMRNQIFGKNAGPTSGMMSLDFHGPSVMFSVGDKNAFALTTRARLFANATDVDGKLVDKISEDFNNDPSLPYTISSNENMRLAINAWSEFGLSYGRIISDKGPHLFKAGITVKYLAGAGNAYMNIDNFRGTIDQSTVLRDVYLQNTTGRVATGFGGINFSDFEAGDLLKMESTGFGADLGFAYEFRRPDDNEHLFKLGLSILDLGSIRYKKDMQRSGAYNIDITGNERLSLRELDGVEFNDLNGFFASHPQYFTAASSNADREYKAALPTSMQIDADYHVLSGLFVNLAGQFSLADDQKAFNNYSYSNFTLTPRFENRWFGAYLPINYNSLSKMNAGLGLRLGPLFVGSGSAISSLIGNSKQVDFYFGIRFGGLRHQAKSPK